MSAFGAVRGPSRCPASINYSYQESILCVSILSSPVFTSTVFFLQILTCCFHCGICVIWPTLVFTAIACWLEFARHSAGHLRSGKSALCSVFVLLTMTKLSTVKTTGLVMLSSIETAPTSFI